jgi:hypothetical protein
MTNFDCTDIRATLSGLVDGEVDAQTRHLAERHLAGCAACRSLLSEAESLDELIVTDAQALGARALPDGFIDGVLSRTVYTRAFEQAGRNWTSWLGWMAAAACLMLSVSIFFLDRARRAGHDPSLSQPRHSTFAVNPGPERSWVWDGEVRPEALLISNIKTIDAGSSPDEDTLRAIDEQLENVVPTAAALQRIVGGAALSPHDALTLDSTSMLMQMLVDSDLTSFSDVDRVRQIAVYDELPQRLADVGSRLGGADRATVMAAEAILLRIVNGPLDLNDLRMLHDAAASMGLANRISAIGAHSDLSSTSL